MNSVHYIEYNQQFAKVWLHFWDSENLIKEMRGIASEWMGAGP